MNKMRIFTGLSSQRGQGLAEYALILLLVAIAIVLSLQLFGNQLSGVISGFVPSF